MLLFWNLLFSISSYFNSLTFFVCMCLLLRAGPRQGHNNPKVQGNHPGNVPNVRHHDSCCCFASDCFVPDCFGPLCSPPKLSSKEFVVFDFKLFQSLTFFVCMCLRLRAGPRQGCNNLKEQGNVQEVRRQRSCLADATLADEGVAFERLNAVKKSNYQAFLRRMLGEWY